MAAAASAPSLAKYTERFEKLAASDLSDQTHQFLRSFVFALGDGWKEISKLEKEFRLAARDANEGKDDLNVVAAAGFLQHHGRERTARERKEEVADVDLDNNGRIAFVEMLLLMYKPMVLQEYEKRTGENLKLDYSKNGIGIVGVGAYLLDELFTLPVGLDPALEKALEEFTASKKARQEKVRVLQELVEKGGVKGLAAKNELAQLDAADTTEMNRIEITLNAAKRKAAKGSGDEALKKQQKAEEDAAKAKIEAGRSKIAARAALWNKKE